MTKVKLKTRKTSTFVYIEHKGAYREIPYENYMEKVFSWSKEKKVRPGFKPMAIFYDDPEKIAPENCKSEIGITIKGKPQSDENIKVKEIPITEVATIKHKGSAEDYPATYKALDDWILKNGYEVTGPFIEIYTKKPKNIGGKTILFSEIQAPIKKK